ncbi:protein arginine N-methyltransferase 6 [Leptopilina heterotoma]|uniref:protein arginine N-methyltransferase 6 n=1 Tax=Leptopilina heterotoma TaxID=63436 RepID=UPI001CA7F015|nr:protein arginine N-methyltransferase 6 [Leptopilina heterotoma]
MSNNCDFQQDNAKYFKSYEDFDVHQLMLNDKSRIHSYKNAIFASKDKFKDKTVMDVGAGTGILSVFCAQAGAKTVYAIEASQLAKIAKEVVIENDFSDVIEVIESCIEDVELNSIDKVDIIVSEWMGFYLIHEGMLDSVIFARDHFLKENGLLFPSIAKLYAAPCELPSFFDFWDDICGVKMRCVGIEHRRVKSLKPEVSIVENQHLLSYGNLLMWLNLYDVTVEDLNLLSGDNTVAICKKDGKCQGICIWFVVEFPDGSELSTSPSCEPTHWKQSVIVLPNEIELCESDPLAFKLTLNRSKSNSRFYNMELTMLEADEVEHEIPCSCNMTKCVIMRTYIEEQESNAKNLSENV